MFKLGEFQKLKVVKKVEHGIYLSLNEGDEDKVLLPKKQVPENVKTGDILEVFIYLDSKDRMISTINKPLITLNECKVLKVVSTGKIGAFLEFGLERDLLLPFKEMTGRVNKGDECLVALYIDKTGRLALTQKVYPYLKTGSPYKAGDEVYGRIYEISDNFGAFVAVDDYYQGLIPKKEMYGNIKVNEIKKLRVLSVTADGKLNLANRKESYIQIDEDVEKIVKVIKEFDGVLPFNDKANAEVIRREFDMSKNEFKRAVGRLYKERKIEITDKSIRLI